ncbi:MAG: transcription elongation factor GreA [Bacteroidales bacterium]|jgi:transcription elongation factor GreA|nr:transcription elongation factor GreA [Bacteroidales bacterium]MEE0910483.1 transcription elongation factor GreA [Bacteroidales bacterium]MEE0993271.1 transcription elongation factor GreA [Bacteroidales bacterium]MEE1002007.1 transcription elongation factor GreA [Bacteroidales bacterium]MEE1203512.1 transcription elongation factor GreA [Bacteroidales bacterium]
MAEIKYYSKEGLQKLKDELHHMITVDRPAISAAIAEARDKGDLSENAEYDAAKEAQGLMEAKIAKLQALIANARLLDETKIDTSKVLLLSKVEFMNLALKKTMTYEIVPESEANIKVGKLSITSPIAKGLLGKKVGDIAEIEVPAGVMKLQITKISRD